MSSTASTAYRTTALAPGVIGTYATLIAMAGMVRSDAAARGVHEKAAQLTEGISGHDPLAQVTALFVYVRDQIRYLKDPIDVEWVQGNSDGFEGLRTLDTERGDCDDKVVLLASLLGSIGIKSRFVIISYDGVQWNHVYLEARLPGRWLALDPTDPQASPGDTQWRVRTQTYDIWPEGMGLGAPSPSFPAWQPVSGGGLLPLDPAFPEEGGFDWEPSSSITTPPGSFYTASSLDPSVTSTSQALAPQGSSNPARQYFPGAQPNPRLDRICNDPTLACVGGGGRFVKCLAAGYSPPCNPLAPAPQGQTGVIAPGAIAPQPVSAASASSGLPWGWIAIGALLLLVSMR